MQQQGLFADIKMRWIKYYRSNGIKNQYVRAEFCKIFYLLKKCLQSFKHGLYLQPLKKKKPPVETAGD